MRSRRPMRAPSVWRDTHNKPVANSFVKEEARLSQVSYRQRQCHVQGAFLMLRSNRKKVLAVSLFTALSFTLTSTAGAQILEVNGSPNQIGISKVWLTPTPCPLPDDNSARVLNIAGNNFD